MKKPCTWMLLFVSNMLFAQSTYIKNETQIGPSDYGIRYAVDAFVNIYEDSKREQSEKEEASAKIRMLRDQYDAYKSYPDSIADGWHNVVATDNLKFCRDAKVLVENNRIRAFAIENCYRIPFTATGKIKKARNIVTLQHFNSEELEVVDLYFIYDLEGPQIVEPPLEPGVVSFWTSAEIYSKEKIVINGMAFPFGIPERFPLSKNGKGEPDCFDANKTLTVVLKPGRYQYRVSKAGNDREGTIEIKAGECLKYRLRSMFD